MQENKYTPYVKKTGTIALWLIILSGVVLRLVIWYQNRNLTLDESNVALNLYERSFTGLCLPLSYEQYAPPIFLWIEKIVALVAGFSEQSLKFYPLITGIASLFLFRNILRYYMEDYIAWFPMAMLSFAFLPIIYATQLKQYMPDMMITLIIINLALATDIQTASKKRFLSIWITTCTLAVWASMPSVFIIAGVVGYYTCICWETKSFRKIPHVALFTIIWLAQFGLYYFTILKAQATSGYLQDYHRGYFLNIHPHDLAECKQNKELIKTILQNAAGNGNDLFMKFHVVLICIAITYFIVKRRKDFFLIVIPIILLLAAAALHRFTLLERVILFCQPLWVLLIGVGFWVVFQLRFTITKVLLVAYGTYLATSSPMFSFLQNKYLFRELTPGLQYVERNGGHADDLYINEATVPIFIYYTQIHPGRDKWKHLYGAHLLKWDKDYRTIADTIRTDAFFVYAGGMTAPELDRRRKEISSALTPAGGLDTFYCTVDYYRYQPKQADKTHK